MVLPLLAVAGISWGYGALSIATANDINQKNADMVSEGYREYYETIDSFERSRNQTIESVRNLGKIKSRIWNRELLKFLKVFHPYKNIILTAPLFTEEYDFMKSYDRNLVKGMEEYAIESVRVNKSLTEEMKDIYNTVTAMYGKGQLDAAGNMLASLQALLIKDPLVSFMCGTISGAAISTLSIAGLAVGPIILAAKAGRQLSEAIDNEAKAKSLCAKIRRHTEEVKLMKDVLEGANQIANDFSSFLMDFSIRYIQTVDKMAEINKEKMKYAKIVPGTNQYSIDFEYLDETQKHIFHEGWLQTQILYNILTTPVLDRNGSVHIKAEKSLLEARALSVKV